MKNKQIFFNVIDNLTSMLNNRIKSELETKVALSNIDRLTEDQIRDLAVKEFIKQLSKEVNSKVEQYL